MGPGTGSAEIGSVGTGVLPAGFTRPIGYGGHGNRELTILIS
jgi:hypothetical protein